MHPLFEPTRMLRAEKGIISNALGHSRGGFTTKVHALVDRKGRPLHIELTQGQRHESTVAEDIIAKHARGKALIADTGYDSDAIQKSAPRPRNQGGHPCEPDTKEQAATRSQALRVPVSCRDVLPQFEALSRHCDAFREDCQELPLATSAHERQAVARRLAAGAGGRNLGQPLGRPRTRQAGLRFTTCPKNVSAGDLAATGHRETDRGLRRRYSSPSGTCRSFSSSARLRSGGPGRAELDRFIEELRRRIAHELSANNHVRLR